MVKLPRDGLDFLRASTPLLFRRCDRSRDPPAHVFRSLLPALIVPSQITLLHHFRRRLRPLANCHGSRRPVHWIPLPQFYANRGVDCPSPDTSTTPVVGVSGYLYH